MNRKFYALGMIIPLAAAGTIATAPAASATPNHTFSVNSDDGDDCDNFRDTLKLRGVISADHDDIKLTVTLTTNHRRSHDDWRVTVRRAGVRALIINDFIDTHTDFDPLGARHRSRQEFKDDATRANRPGPDHFVARAVNRETREACVVHLRVGPAADRD